MNRNHYGLASAAATLFVATVTAIYSAGVLRADLRAAEDRIAKIERDGCPPVREINARLDIYGKQIEQLQADSRNTARELAEMKADLRVVAEWVKEQKSHRP